MKNLKFIFIFLFAQINNLCYGQTKDTVRAVVVQDERINGLLNKYILMNGEKRTIEGYRVQIFFASGNNSKKMANDTKTEFLANHPTISTYILFQSPNFKVRVGDFRTKLDAYKFYKEIVADYPSAFIVKDDITLPKID